MASRSKVGAGEEPLDNWMVARLQYKVNYLIKINYFVKITLMSQSIAYHFLRNILQTTKIWKFLSKNKYIFLCLLHLVLVSCTWSSRRSISEEWPQSYPKNSQKYSNRYNRKNNCWDPFEFQLNLSRWVHYAIIGTSKFRSR